MPTRKPIIKPSRTRSMGPLETAFMLGEPKGEFDPAPMYCDSVTPLDHRCGYACSCERNQNCEPDELPFTPDPQHSTVHATVRAPAPLIDWGRLACLLIVLGGVCACYAAMIGVAWACLG